MLGQTRFAMKFEKQKNITHLEREVKIGSKEGKNEPDFAAIRAQNLRILLK